jgi:hypothetical protein
MRRPGPFDDAGPSPWLTTFRADQPTRIIADRHYNRQKVGAKQFVPPGRCVVLRALSGDAAWVTSWPFAEYVQHAWAGAWVNSLFRNERAERGLSPVLIRAAVAATRAVWPEVPELGMVTFVDPTKVRSQNPGCCYLMAGFRRVRDVDGRRMLTKAGLHVFQMLPADMPEPAAAAASSGAEQLGMFGGAQ